MQVVLERTKVALLSVFVRQYQISSNTAAVLRNEAFDSETALVGLSDETLKELKSLKLGEKTTSRGRNYSPKLEETLWSRHYPSQLQRPRWTEDGASWTTSPRGWRAGYRRLRQQGHKPRWAFCQSCGLCYLITRGRRRGGALRRSDWTFMQSPSWTKCPLPHGWWSEDGLPCVCTVVPAVTIGPKFCTSGWVDHEQNLILVRLSGPSVYLQICWYPSRQLHVLCGWIDVAV